MTEFAIVVTASLVSCIAALVGGILVAVSYTHLTLPTIA